VPVAQSKKLGKIKNGRRLLRGKVVGEEKPEGRKKKREEKTGASPETRSERSWDI